MEVMEQAEICSSLVKKKKKEDVKMIKSRASIDYQTITTPYTLVERNLRESQAERGERARMWRGKAARRKVQLKKRKVKP